MSKISFDLYEKSLNFYKSGNLTKAIDSMNKALELDDNVLDYYVRLSAYYIQNADYKNAEVITLKGMNKFGDIIELINHMAIVYSRTYRLKEAIMMLEISLKIKQDSLETLLNICSFEGQLGNLDKALNYALAAVSLKPDSAEAHNNLGTTFDNMARLEEAKFCFETALTINPKNIEALANLGACQSKLGYTTLAIETYEKAISACKRIGSKQSEVLKFFVSFDYFRAGNFEKGYVYHEAGFHPNVPSKHGRAPRRLFNVPKWDGRNLHNKKLLVWREQGLGDEIMFYSMIPDLIKRVGNIIIECDPRLCGVLSRSFSNITVRNFVDNIDQFYFPVINDFDFHIPQASLMKLLRPNINSFKNSGPYISVDPLRVDKFKNRLNNSSQNIKIGICWRSGTIDPLRAQTYLNILELEPLFKLKNVDWVLLQYGDCENECLAAEQKFGIKIIRWSDLNLKDDIEDVFALMSVLDYTVTVATAVQHMSAAVGTKTLLLTPEAGWNRFGNSFDPWFSNLIPFEAKIIDGHYDMKLQIPILINYINSQRL